MTVTPVFPVLVWFRRDLRLADNPALLAAAASGRPLLPVFVLDDETPGNWAPGAASRWWLHHSLASLRRDLGERGLPLILRRGPADKVVLDLAAETGAAAVHWNRLYEPALIARDTELKTRLGERGVAAGSHAGTVLYEPWTVTTRKGGFYMVFTRFWQACRAVGDPPPPLPPLPPLPASLPTAPAEPASDDLAGWRLLPTAPDWAGGLRQAWVPGETGAAAALDRFLEAPAASYADARDIPAEPATSGLSPHLHFGEIGPRQVWHAVVQRLGWSGSAEAFLKELTWREFARHVLYHVPDLPDRPMDRRFEDFPWRDDPEALRAWQQGRTGYPLVDAGMRELWSTGAMHNRVRMVAASFLAKHLLAPWQAGEAWFWDALVDADLASNSFNWQWVAGCGADAAPYFRIFNPVRQGERFDPEGRFVRRWLPELASLPDNYVHAPWTAPAAVLAAAGVRLGETYPRPIVDHKAARERALAAFQSIKR